MYVMNSLGPEDDLWELSGVGVICELYDNYQIQCSTVTFRKKDLGIENIV